MKVLVIAPSLAGTSPGSRFRIEQWMALMAPKAEFDYASFEDESLHRVMYMSGHWFQKARGVVRCLWNRFDLTRRIRDYDVVFLYEEASRLGPALLERMISRSGVPIVYDFCDPIFLPYKSPRNHYLSYLKFFGKTATICKLATHVLVGNEALAKYARQYNPRVTIVPITIDTALYAHRKEAKREGSLPVIGWSGSHTTVPHLDGLRGALQKLRKQRPFLLRVIGDEKFSIDGIETEASPWRGESEIEDLETFDIGIMPLPGDPWTRLRSHLKVRQYMGLGIPSVVSPVGVNTEVVEDGVNGFFAATEDEWVEKLRRLIDDPALRAAIGAAGRRTIETRYSAAQWTPVVLEILERAAGKRPQPEPMAEWVAQ